MIVNMGEQQGQGEVLSKRLNARQNLGNEKASTIYHVIIPMSTYNVQPLQVQVSWPLKIARNHFINLAVGHAGALDNRVTRSGPASARGSKPSRRARSTEA